MPTRTFIVAGFLCLLPLITCAQSNNFTLLRILQKYTEDYGGFRDADALASLSVEGTIEQDGGTYDFLMRKKQPYGFRYRLSDDSGFNSAVTGYNGREGWLRTDTNGEVNVSEITGAPLETLREQARFEGPLFRHLEKSEYTFSFVGRDQVNGDPVYIISVETKAGQQFHYFLQARDSHILRIDSLGSEGDIISQTLYRDYREVGGFPFAHEVETIVDGERVSLARVQKIDVNPGLLSFYFETPSR